MTEKKSKLKLLYKRKGKRRVIKRKRFKRVENIKFGAKVEMARREFFWFCKLFAPEFYKEDREYLVELCYQLQKFYEADNKEVMIINMPPRHGKTRTAAYFVQWVLGKDISNKIIMASYNEKIGRVFSRGIKADIAASKEDDFIAVYSDVFEHAQIEKGQGDVNIWSLRGGYNNYLLTSPLGTVTGFGCNIMIVDDIIKNAEEAYNEYKKDAHWDWFVNTMLSRLEEGGKVIIIMTRWAEDDLAGRARKHFTDNGVNVEIFSRGVVDKEGNMICDEILSRESYEKRVKSISPEIVSANYMQKPIEKKGRLYKGFRTYSNDDGIEFKKRAMYIDTADTGEDYLCGICYGVSFNNEAYVIDIIYTQDSMEETEEKTAKMIYENEINEVFIESNNGGRGFARAVERILREKYRSSRAVIKPFHQNKNKRARIFAASSWVMRHVYFPVGWERMYEKYYQDMTRYSATGKNKHDDAPDATTGIYEKIMQGDVYSFE